jgi:micrococcal nuclease
MSRSMRLVRLLFATAALGCVFAAGADAATRGPCIPGKSRPVCYHWDARVNHISDDDTLSVDVLGDGTGAAKRVRMTGINAMELDVYASNRREGTCHAVEAAERLEGLIEGARNRVRLSAQDPASRSGSRLRRAVSIWSGGRWVDLGQLLVDEGHVQFNPNPIEWAHNRSYARGVQMAARAGQNLWDPTYCGVGPEQEVPLRMWVNWDSDRNAGRRSVDGEWVKIKNEGVTDLPIGGWLFRDSLPIHYNFPSDAVIKAGHTITLYMGRRPDRDTNHVTHFYWGQRNAVFQNVERRRSLGDGGYLFDRAGDLRVYMMYPCRVSCSDPLVGHVTVRAQPKAPEKVYVRNIGTVPANLEGYVLENVPYNYVFPQGIVLLPGEVLRVIVKGSPGDSERLVRYWGKTKYILNDRGDRVALRTQTNIFIDCYAWGSERC